jgi:uncharacterized protein
MLLEFTTGNYRSFRDKVTLSLVASRDDSLEDENVGTTCEYRAVRAAAIYGPNGSGKSNLLLAFNRMRRWVLNSSKDSQHGESIPVAPFRLNTRTEAAPSFFEVIFLAGTQKYRYGFEATAEMVLSEWLLVQVASIRETTLFVRQNGEIKPGTDFREGKGLEERTRPNALFLSVVAQFNGKIAGEVVAWFEAIRGISGLQEGPTTRFRSDTLGNPANLGIIREMIRQADVGIEDIRERSVDPAQLRLAFPVDLPEPMRERMLEDMRRPELKTYHRKFDGDQRTEELVEFDLARDESAGTRKFVQLLGPFLDALQRGSLLVVDEFEARLHPKLSRTLVRLFNSAVNQKNSQLVFASHDPGLLSPRYLRRDQVWFVEKDEAGASSLYPLSDFSVRKGALFEKEYLAGEFGAIPHLGDLREIFLHASKE